MLAPISASDVGGFGADTISVTLDQKKDTGSACTCKPEIVVSGAGNERSLTKTMSFWATPPVTESFWPFNASPRVYNVSVEGCKCPPRQFTVECFPPAEVELDFNIKELKKNFQPFEEAVKGIAEFLQGTKPEFNYLEGDIKGKWGWKEQPDHTAALEMELTVGFQPLIEFKNVRIPIDVMPFVPGFIREYTGDLYGYIRFDGKIDGSFFWRKKSPVPPGGKRWENGGQVAVGVTVYAGVEAHVGADQVVAVRLGARLEAPFKGKIEAICDDDKGPGFDGEITWDGLSGEIYTEIKGHGWINWGYEGSLEVAIIKGGTLWDPPAWFPFKE
jgi:hypothetical protein